MLEAVLKGLKELGRGGGVILTELKEDGIHGDGGGANGENRKAAENPEDVHDNKTGVLVELLHDGGVEREEFHGDKMSL